MIVDYARDERQDKDAPNDRDADHVKFDPTRARGELGNLPGIGVLDPIEISIRRTSFETCDPRFQFRNLSVTLGHVQSPSQEQYRNKAICQ